MNKAVFSLHVSHDCFSWIIHKHSELVLVFIHALGNLNTLLHRQHTTSLEVFEKTTTSKCICTLLFTVSCIRDGTLVYYMQQFHRNSIWLHKFSLSTKTHFNTLSGKLLMLAILLIHKLKARNPFLSSIFNNNKN